MEDIIFLSEQTTDEESTLKIAKSSEAVESGQALATLEGPFADAKRATRNGRKYPVQLWERILSSSHVKEMLDTKTFFGEADHPTMKEERLEVSLPKVSHNITELWLDESDGIIYGRMDILDTPSGRILKTLVDYGSILGISSRGAGRVIKENAESLVDASTYNFITFDVVPLPANVASRLKETTTDGVSESSQLSMVGAISEQVDSILDKDDRSELTVVRSVLESINMPELEPLCEKVSNALDNDTSVSSVENDLSEAYKTISTLRSQISELEDAVRVHESKVENGSSDTITLPNESILERLDDNFSTVLAKIGGIEDKVDTVETKDLKISELHEKLDEAHSEVSKLTSRVEHLLEDLDSNETQLESYDQLTSELEDQLLEKKDKVSELSDKLGVLEESNEALKSINTELNTTIENLNIRLDESDSTVDELNESIQLNNTQYNELIDEVEDSTKLVSELEEDLKESEFRANSLSGEITNLEGFVDAYVRIRAKQVGVSPNAVMRSLPESFTPEIVESTLKELAVSRVHQDKITHSPRTSNLLAEATTVTPSPKDRKRTSLVSIVQGVGNNSRSK